MTNSKPMNYGVKIAGRDEQLVLATPYLYGARVQLERYSDAFANAKDGVDRAVKCFHEVSTLLEDLDCLSVYFENVGKSHSQHKLWKEARQHIRHDMRDAWISERNQQKTTSRAKFLNLREEVTGSVGFDQNAFNIGGVTVGLDEVNSYLDWADQQYRAYEQGLIETGRLHHEK